MTNRSRRSAGFTLIEIMAVVIIIGLLSGLVGLAVFGRVGESRVSIARTQMKTIENALELYRMDNSSYPSTEQGLEALIAAPSTPPEPRRYNPEGYLSGGKVPLDPWDEPFQYQSPGQHNPRGFDIWSLGADRAPGGSDENADIGNWDDEQA
jgi:general secretion pathway protein G